MLKSFPLLAMQIPLPEYFITASEEVFLLLIREMPLLKKFALLASFHVAFGVKLFIKSFSHFYLEIAQSNNNLVIQGEKIELINELVKYQDHHAKIPKYQTQQSKPRSKKEQREFYMSVLRSHSGWKTKHFRGMTLEEIREKFIPVWKQIEDFVPMASKGKAKRFKRKGPRYDEYDEQYE
nr:hypothetical protein [Tanacetum cinerariifolium]